MAKETHSGTMFQLRRMILCVPKRRIWGTSAQYDTRGDIVFFSTFVREPFGFGIIRICISCDLFIWQFEKNGGECESVGCASRTRGAVRYEYCIVNIAP